MFECCTSLSWTKLLLHRNHISWHEERFDLWPHITVSPMELWNRLDDWIINKVIKERLPVWNTSKRCVSSEEGIFFESNPGNEKYAFALDQVMLPAIYLPADLHQKTKMQVTLLSQTILVGSPPIVRQFLQKNRTFLNPDIPSLLLEYCLLDIMNGDLEGPSRRDLYDSFQSIPIWPVVNGGLAKPGELLLPRSEYEKDLFAIARSSNTIDIGRLEPAVLKLLLEDIVNLSALMRFRSLMDLRIDWPAIYPLEDDPRNSGSLLRRDVALDETLEKIWSWICTRAQQESLSLRALEGLWIIPVDNSRLRQVSPRIQSPLMLVPDKRRPLYETVKNITLGKDSITSPILDVDVLSTNTTKLLRNQAKAEYSFRGACQTHLWPLVSWLAAGEKLLRAASDQQKMVILEELGFLAKKTSLLPSDISAHRNEMRKLPLFSRITSESPYRYAIFTTGFELANTTVTVSVL